MQNFNPFAIWQQACAAPWQAQATYWQTVSAIMQARIQAANTWQLESAQCLQQMAQCRTAGEWQECFGKWAARSTSQAVNLAADTHAARVNLWRTWQNLARQSWQSGMATACAPQPATPPQSRQPQPQPTPQPTAASTLQSALNTIASKAKPQPAPKAAAPFTGTPQPQPASTRPAGPTIQVGKLAQPFPPSNGKFTPALPGTFIPAQKQHTAAELPLAQPQPRTQTASQSQAEPTPTVTALPRTRQTGGQSGAASARAAAASSARHSVVARRSASRRAR